MAAVWRLHVCGQGQCGATYSLMTGDIFQIDISTLLAGDIFQTCKHMRTAITNRQQGSVIPQHTNNRQPVKTIHRTHDQDCHRSLLSLRARRRAKVSYSPKVSKACDESCLGRRLHECSSCLQYTHKTTFLGDYDLSESIKTGVESTGATCDIFQVPETLSDEALTELHAPPKGDYPVIGAKQMAEYDGIMFGLSCRFGSIPTQMKAFMDSCGSLWRTGALVGKAAGTFCSAGALGGGQETVNLTAIPFFAHLGMVFVPLGFGFVEPKVFSFDEIHGASAYGSGTYCKPDGSRFPSDLEKDIAVSHGKHFATIAAKLAKPKE
jgi:NAD(P)H dehydrogenase (quinone)